MYYYIIFWELIDSNRWLATAITLMSGVFEPNPPGCPSNTHK